MTLTLTAEQWNEAAHRAESEGKKVVIGASCEACQLEISPAPYAVPGQCRCGKLISLAELIAAHGLEEYAHTFMIGDIVKEVG